MNEDMPKNMKKCPTCGTLVAKSAKVCPNCGAKLKNNVLMIVIIVVVVLLCLCCCGAGISISKKSDADKAVEKVTSGDSSSSDGSDTDSAKTDGSSSNSENGDVSYEITDTKLEWYTNSIGSKEYYGIVEVTNTGNTNLYLKACTFDLEDDTGHLLQSDDFISSGPDVIEPNEKGYFYNDLGSISLNDGVSTSNGINLVPQINIVKATGEAVNLEVTDTELKYDYNKPVVTGRVVNSTDAEQQDCYVQILFYDSNNKVIAVGDTHVYNIPAGGKSSFEFSGAFMNDNVTSDKIANYTIKAQSSYYQW